MVRADVLVQFGDGIAAVMPEGEQDEGSAERETASKASEEGHAAVLSGNCAKGPDDLPAVMTDMVSDPTGSPVSVLVRRPSLAWEETGSEVKLSMQIPFKPEMK